jgi:HD-GYP domain-containing protein (c-di-GMP phosphodiesterase class II)
MKENRADRKIKTINLNETGSWTDIRQFMMSLPKEQILHSENVKKYMEIFANIMQYAELENASEIEEEYLFYGRSAYYHDIGKSMVPGEILTKPDRLSAGEYRIIQKHTVYARELFYQVDFGIITGMPHALFHLAKEAAVYHHEWWNGKGYPYGLRGEKIPFFARATALCDAYDAMTSNRSYREEGTHEYVCQKMKCNAGIQFDPKLAQIFLSHEELFHKENEKIKLSQLQIAGI